MSTRQSATAAVTVAHLCARFIDFKQSRLDAGELSARTLESYQSVSDDLLAAFGPDHPIEPLGPYDFDQLRRRFAQHLGPRGVGAFIRMTRTIFKWAWEMGLLERPKRYGGMFDMPPKRAVRAATTAPQVIEPATIRQLLEAAEGSPVHAFILLGINCGFGNNDCAQLTGPAARQAVATGFLEFPRPKTGIPREAALWPETIAALEQHAHLERPAGPAFLTCRGHRFVRARIHRRDGGQVAKVVHIDALRLQFRKVAERAGVAGAGGAGGGARFYNLRRTFRTVADDLNDPHATARVMGHEIPGMAGVYVQRIAPDRLRRIADHVWKWVFSPRAVPAGGAYPASAPPGEPVSASGPSPPPSSTAA